MMKALFREEGAALRIGIIAEKPAQDFIQAHAQVLDGSFSEVKMSDTMRSALQRSNYIFSGFKTFHELNEAAALLIDSNGNRKPFEQFLNDVRKIDDTYNRNYLRAEYNFCHSSAQMAAKWDEFQADGDDYNLQYRTAADGRVRPEHAALHGVTLPPSDPFWKTYFPPNGWNCRCNVVQVLRDKYPTTPHDEAMQRGAEATGKDTRGIFRFNPGIERKTFPDYNPYTISRCRDCDIAKGNLKLAKFIPEHEICQSCKILQKCVADKTKSQTAIERTHYLHEMRPLLKVKQPMETKDGVTIKVGFSKEGNEHLFSDTFKRSKILQKEDLKHLDELLKKATLIDEAECYGKKKRKGYQHFYYYEAELHGKKVRLNVAKWVRTHKTGWKEVKYFLYSINDIKE